MATIADRIKEAMARRGVKQSDLVSMTGIGKSSISTYLSGEYEPKQRNIYKIAKALDVNEAWLMGEDVIMDRIDMSAFLEAAGKSAAEDTAFLKRHSGLIMSNDFDHDIGCSIHCRNKDELDIVKGVLMSVVQLQIAEQSEKLAALQGVIVALQHMPTERSQELLNYANFLSNH